MKSIKNYFIISLLLALALFLAACGGDSDDDGAATDDGAEETETEAPAEENGEEEATDGDSAEFVSLLTGGTSGTYYPLGGEIANIISNETGIQTDIQSSNASADNVIALAEGEAELAFVQTDVVAFAAEGINAFEEPVDNVLAIGNLYPESIQIVTTADSGIESVEDLAGKAVSVGAPGSGTYINAEQILEVHGMTMDDLDTQHLAFDESTSGIQDGNIDAAFITAGWPTGAVEGLGATVDVSIVGLEQDKIDEIIELYPYYAEDTIPGGTYGGIDEDISTVAVGAMIAVVDTMSEDDVYEMTKALYENSDQITHSRGANISVEGGVEGIGIPFHPGAERYFQEAGVLE